MYFQYFQISFFMHKDQMTGGILFLSCRSVVNINIRYNFLTICDRDFFWHVYSTNKALSNDSDIHSEKNLFYDAVAARGTVFPCVCVICHFPPKYHILHHLGSAASPISLIRLWTTTVLILTWWDVNRISCYFTQYYSCCLQMLYAPKDSKSALNHRTGTFLYRQKISCLCKKTVKLIYFDCVFAIRAYYQSLKTRNIYKI